MKMLSNEQIWVFFIHLKYRDPQLQAGENLKHLIYSFKG